MSIFTEEELNSDVYRWRKSGRKRILVQIFYQIFNLRDAANRDLWKRHEDNEENVLDIDAVYLKKLFEDKQYFPAGAKVECIPLRTFDHTKQLLEEMDKNFAENEHYDCFFFVFLTFAEPDGRLHFSEKKSLEKGLVHLEKIVDVVKNLHVTRGKPKIFLIQADDLTLTKPKEYEKGPEVVEFELVKIPTDVDRLIIQSTIPQKIVTGAGRQESFLIQAFVEAIKNNCTSQSKLDFYSLTTTINGKVSAMIQNTWPLPVRAEDMPVPLVTSTLTRLLNLHESSDT
jgi:hypothetical protein